MKNPKSITLLLLLCAMAFVIEVERKFLLPTFDGFPIEVSGFGVDSSTQGIEVQECALNAEKGIEVKADGYLLEI